MIRILESVLRESGLDRKCRTHGTEEGGLPAAACVVIRTLFIIKQMSDAFHIEYAL